jgi:hypothetical protein
VLGRVRSVKQTIVAACAGAFVLMVPLVAGANPSKTHRPRALTPPPSFLDALNQGGFNSGQLAPSQQAPVVQSAGS